MTFFDLAFVGVLGNGFEFFDAGEEIWEAADVGLEFGFLADGECGFPGVDGVSGEVGGGSTAGGEDGFCADDYVACDARLGCYGDVVFDFAAAGEAGLGDDEAVFTDDYVVGDLAEVIDFCAFSDDGFPEAGAIDGGICADLDVVMDFYDADLFDFYVAAIEKLVAVAV